MWKVERGGCVHVRTLWQQRMSRFLSSRARNFITETKGVTAKLTRIVSCSGAPVVGRGHVSLLTILDAWHSGAVWGNRPTALYHSPSIGQSSTEGVSPNGMLFQTENGTWIKTVIIAVFRSCKNRRDMRQCSHHHAHVIMRQCSALLNA